MRRPRLLLVPALLLGAFGSTAFAQQGGERQPDYVDNDGTPVFVDDAQGRPAQPQRPPAARPAAPTQQGPAEQAPAPESAARSPDGRYRRGGPHPIPRE